MQNPRMTQSAEPVSVECFLKNVLRSGVLDREQLRGALRDVPLDLRENPEAVADHLVEAGKLSRFQAGKLLRGMAVGLVLGPFHVLAPIGRGGMGTVYLARDSRSDQLVALKVLPPKRAREEERVLTRFRREMEMCRRVAHPHLAWVCEVGVYKGVYYIALEYIPGKSLYRLVSDQGPLEVSRAARLFAEVASALDHAHNQGLVHRDLKPSNIVVTPHDHAKVLDLGLALVQGEAPSDREVIGGRGYVVGTMDYIAPEQAENSATVDARSDIYSLGCTLYFAFTGQPPFPGGTALEKIQRHRTEEPVPVPQLNPAVPPPFIGLLRKMMAKNPEQRIATAAEVEERLRAWASSDNILPLDQKGDKEYQEAVIALETAEAAPELIAEVIPVGIPVGATRKRCQPPPLPLPDSIKSPLEAPQACWRTYLVWIGLGFGSCILLGLVGLLIHLLAR
jgi:eukaryotic-like serine/threonine-protein kinase